ncbi:MAG: ABC transporter ATP-binding protein [Cetobacterium sp.]|uniref:ABC transporter ATP-binding protein n=1 Tax=Cetobacterium sp. TaxID=2071632 RepID=UPI003F2A2C9A
MHSLKVNNLNFNYKNCDNILKNLSFYVKQMELVSIVGGSGCGKTTIIKILSNIEKATSGDISIGNISYMPQSDTLLPWRNIIDNILLPIEIKKTNRVEAKIKAENLLEKFNLLKYSKKYPKELSGGMKQRISFIRTLMNESDLLLLDEPFSALDAITRQELQLWLLDSLIMLKKSMIFITHDIDEAIFLSNRILVCTEIPISNFKEFQIPKNATFKDKSFIKKEILKAIKGVEVDEN